MAGIEIQEPSDSVKVPDLEVQGARKLGNVIAHLHMRIKNSIYHINEKVSKFPYYMPFKKRHQDGKGFTQLS